MKDFPSYGLDLLVSYTQSGTPVAASNVVLTSRQAPDTRAKWLISRRTPHGAMPAVADIFALSVGADQRFERRTAHVEHWLGLSELVPEREKCVDHLDLCSRIDRPLSWQTQWKRRQQDH